ncbi:MAG: hypothetical protein WC255_06520 [Bacteroidales bacterium]|jgi:pseudo-rSAM protein
MNTGYWFYIEPYTFFVTESNSVLLINLLDDTIIEDHNYYVTDLIKSLTDSNNLGVTFISEEEYTKNKKFIQKLQMYFMGDIIPINISPKKPVQFLSQLQLNNTQEIQEELILNTKKSLSSLLTNFFVFVDNNCKSTEKVQLSYKHSCKFFDKNTANYKKMRLSDLQSIIHILSKLPSLKNIRITGCDNWSKKDIIWLSTMSSMFACNIILCITLEMYNKNLALFQSIAGQDQFKIELIVDLEKENIDISLFISSAISIWTFLVDSPRGFSKFEYLMSLEAFMPHSGNLSLIANDTNFSFVEQIIFITKNDILSSTNFYSTIALNKSINSNFWGKAYVFPNGNISLSPYTQGFHNILEDSLDVVVDDYLKSDNFLWFQIRDNDICNNCIFQYLCPPPSVYEKLLNKNAICFKNISS